MAFLTGRSWGVLKSWYKGGGPEQRFLRLFTNLLNQSLVSSETQAKIEPELKHYIFLPLITDTNHCLHVILVYGGPEQRFLRLFTNLLNQSLVSSETQAKIEPELKHYIFLPLITDTNHCLHVIF